MQHNQRMIEIGKRTRTGIRIGIGERTGIETEIEMGEREKKTEMGTEIERKTKTKGLIVREIGKKPRKGDELIRMLMIVIETETEREIEKATGKILTSAIFQNYGQYHNTFSSYNHNSHDNNTDDDDDDNDSDNDTDEDDNNSDNHNMDNTSNIIRCFRGDSLSIPSNLLFDQIFYGIKSTVTFLHLMLPQYLVLYHFNFDFMLSLWLYFLKLSIYLYTEQIILKLQNNVLSPRLVIFI